MPPLSSVALSLPANLLLRTDPAFDTPLFAPTLMARGIDPATRAFLQRQLTHLWDWFHATEAETSMLALHAGAAGHHHALTELARWSLPEEDRGWLVGALCEAEILAGRLARDQLNPDTAIAHHRAALALAQQTENAALITASSMRLAETLLDTGLPYEALAYCEAAFGHSKHTNARIAGELLGLSAEVHSAIGSRREAERLVAEAARLAVGAVALPTAGGINFSETAAAEYQADEALRRGDRSSALGHITRAMTLLATEFSGVHNVRWRAHLHIDRARVHRYAREVEAACDDLIEAARLSRSIGSRVGLRKVQEAASALMQDYAPHARLVRLRDELVQLCQSEMSAAGMAQRERTREGGTVR
jgi:hypothetical protein